ncbi:hypothetical protein C8R43DRAFT_994084 [Mycena crocata]|nr:hypothetical protein C8R43DRAFT_994084 [Mycena crocata]
MSSQFRVRKLDPAGFEASDPGSLPEIRDIESVLSKAFTGEVFTAVVTGKDPAGKDTSHIGPFWISTVVAGLLGGDVYIAETNDSRRRIVGCAVWFGPGHNMYDTEDQEQHALGPLMSSFSDELQHWWHAMFLPNYDTFVNSTLGDGTKHDSWHLQTLGVDPEYQRQGVATLLVNTVCEEASRTGTRLCVETESELDVEIYTRLGFVLMPLGEPIDTCSRTFTGVDGNSFRMWVLARGPG